MATDFLSGLAIKSPTLWVPPAFGPSKSVVVFWALEELVGVLHWRA